MNEYGPSTAENAEMKKDKTFDVVVFGVTGVTGKHVAMEMKKFDDVKWAVAARSEEKAKNILQEIDCPTVPVIEADVKNFESLIKMCQSTKIVLNCVGPYMSFGEPVLKACLENSSHHIDVSGEPQFLEKMQLKYHQEAKDAGVLVIGSCGVDSVPCEMGVEHMKKNFKGQLNSIETYLTLKFGEKGYTMNVGTFFSVIAFMSNILSLRSLKRQLYQTHFPKQLPRLHHRQKRRGYLFHNNDVQGWCMPLEFLDQRVADRTQRMNYELNDERPIQLNSYMKISTSFFLALFALIGMVNLFLFSLTRCGRYLLHKYPAVFTLGMFDFGGPTEEQIQGTSFSLLLCGRGWDDKELNHTVRPQKTTKLVIKGPDPAYVTTAICMTQAAMVILQERDKMALKSGVLTPGIAFANTTLIERLQNSGIKFERML